MRETNKQCKINKKTSILQLYLLWVNWPCINIKFWLEYSFLFSPIWKHTVILCIFNWNNNWTVSIAQYEDSMRHEYIEKMLPTRKYICLSIAYRDNHFPHKLLTIFSHQSKTVFAFIVNLNAHFVHRLICICKMHRNECRTLFFIY